MVRKKFRLRKIKRLFSIMLFLVMLLGTGLLSPTFAYTTAEKSIVQSLPDAQNLVDQGRKHYEAERFAQAAASWQQAISAFAQGDELTLAMTLGNLSLAYQQLGQWNAAEEAISQSLNLLKATKPNPQVLAQILDIKGRLLLAQSKPEDALNIWQQAASIYQKIDDTNAIIRNQINSAQALQTLGYYRQAQKTLEESIQILQQQPNSPLKVTGLRSLGNVIQVTGDLATSRQILQQSLEVASSLQDKQAVAEILLSLGNTARAEQDIPTAIKFYQQAANAATSPSTSIQAQVNQLRLLLETEQIPALTALSSQIQAQLSNLPASRTAIFARINFAQTLTQFKKKYTTDTLSWLDIAQLLSVAIEQAKNLEDKRTQSYAVGVLGGVYEQTQQWNDAQQLTQQALLMAQAIDAKDIAYRWQWQLGRLLKARGDIKGAFVGDVGAAIAAYTEAVNYLQALRYDLARVNSQVRFSFREEVEPVYRELVQLLLQPQGNSQINPENIEKASETIELLQIAELENFFRNTCLNTRTITKKTNQTAAVIYPFILPDRVEVIVNLPQNRWLHYSTTIDEQEVQTTLKQLQEDLRKPHTLRQVQSLSQKVYNWLIQPGEVALVENKIPSLVFVLDSWLRNIPMAALYDGKQYLIEKYAVALSPGQNLIEPKPLQKDLKIIAAGLSESRSGFSALPNVKQELETIRSELPSSILLNQEFTSKSLQDLINSLPFPVVHLATHGQFSSKAEETFILAWDDRIYVKQLNNLFRTVEQNKPEAIELLVLSACQTAAGDARAALGIAGVAFQAGARSTIASLWNLDDESTALLMGKFYQELANKKITKAEALRRAQLALLQNPQYKRPLYWAPYVLLGNWL
ncbi:CHAT domain-containing protein [Nostoc sp. FACHB-152]|uniref:CHAT domain-containing protein n=1 Tax=unclassified Nostoc TaxID=2593658 RepID=UPI001689901E|nr:MULTISPECIES: CHAT domain-containing protein [unclassified Nostoc]MBD2450318.1 CHAT domain-containing protein [Nostoc sp. FACHB-152]MBD2471778.1 CHAT domain-containing protein [Nostoc sp. FACHB-145]